MDQALSKPGISVAPLASKIAIESVNLPGELHGDPDARMLVAKARILGDSLFPATHVRAIEA